MDHPVLLKPRLSILHCFIELCTLRILLQIIRSSRNSMKKRGRSLSHFVQPTAWHFKFNLFSCAISNQYFNNFLKEMAIGYFLFFDLTSNHQTDTYEKNNQLQGVSNHDISLSRKEMWDTFLFFMFNQLSKVTV